MNTKQRRKYRRQRLFFTRCYGCSMDSRIADILVLVSHSVAHPQPFQFSTRKSCLIHSELAKTAFRSKTYRGALGTEHSFKYMGETRHDMDLETGNAFGTET